MGMVKHAIHEIMEGSDSYAQAADRVEEAGLGTDCEMLREFWNGTMCDLDDEDAPPRAYEQARYNQFVRDMIDAGLEPYHYRGRFFYEGPAVNVDGLQDAHRHTDVPCQSDNMGLGYVVYPK
jgi:hypothetical protein